MKSLFFMYILLVFFFFPPVSRCSLYFWSICFIHFLYKKHHLTSQSIVIVVTEIGINCGTNFKCISKLHWLILCSVPVCLNSRMLGLFIGWQFYHNLPVSLPCNILILRNILWLTKHIFFSRRQAFVYPMCWFNDEKRQYKHTDHLQCSILYFTLLNIAWQIYEWRSLTSEVIDNVFCSSYFQCTSNHFCLWNLILNLHQLAR